jgi:DNA-binding NtrC family response regulator
MESSHPLTLFIQRDDRWNKFLPEHQLNVGAECSFTHFDNLEEVFSSIQNKPDAIILNAISPFVKMEEAIHRIKELYPGSQIIIICETENRVDAVELSKNGVFDYVINDEELQDRLSNILRHWNSITRLQEEIQKLQTNGQEEKTLREYELQIIQQYLDRYNHDVMFVAKKLGIGKSTIYRMIQAGELKH